MYTTYASTTLITTVSFSTFQTSLGIRANKFTQIQFLLFNDQASELDGLMILLIYKVHHLSTTYIKAYLFLQILSHQQPRSPLQNFSQMLSISLYLSTSRRAVVGEEAFNVQI